MAVEKLPVVNPPASRVPGKGLLTLPSSEALRWRNDSEIHDSRKSARVFSQDSKYRPKEGTGRGFGKLGKSPCKIDINRKNWHWVY
ncbi:hypothetical protein D1007_41953 [Hordeum vulgare]|nr:hypothetical protein D1007_41953 [Hordeum vulgare]